MFSRFVSLFCICLFVAACASLPTPSPVPQMGGSSGLPDKIAFSQEDPRWAQDRMGGSGRTLKAEGCLVTAAAMALTNLGFEITPGEFNTQLKRQNGYTGSGLLVWAAIERITSGGATARFYTDVNKNIIRECMADGFYPLVRFILPSGRTHWAVIIKESERGYHMRDPLHISRRPLIFPQGISGLKAVRCVGRKI